jgi:hypothetical protein
MWLPVFQLPDQLLAGEAVTAPISGLRLANFALSGTILVASFHLHQAAILSRHGGGGFESPLRPRHK